MPIINYFPYLPKYKPYTYQENSINELKNALDNGYKYIFLEAPTGSGKSAIARTLTDYYTSKNKKSFICTKTKMLQSQYLKECGEYNNYDYHFEKIVGKSNFKCINLSDNKFEVTCDDGLCTFPGINYMDYFSKDKSKKDEAKRLFDLSDNNPCFNNCEYRLSLKRFKKCDIGICNYHILLADSLYAHNYPSRELLICDEAHDLIKLLRDFGTLTINIGLINTKLSFETNKKEYEFNCFDEIIEPYNVQLNNSNDWLNFIDCLKESVNKWYDFVKVECNNNEKDYAPIINKMNKFIVPLIMKKDQVENDLSNYIFESDKNKLKSYYIPLTVNSNISNLIFDKGEQIVLMSGSFTNIELEAKTLGIKNYYKISIPEQRNLVKNNPIYYRPCGKMKYTEREKTLPKIYDEIEYIINTKTNSKLKGLIHTTGYVLTEKIIDNVFSDRLITHKPHDSADLIKTINYFKNSDEPLILVSPSIYEGVDFPGNNCGFQILPILPVPYISSFYTELSKQYPDLYRMEIAKKIIQTIGRGCRGPNDKCKNYLLDSRFQSCTYNNNFYIKLIDFPESIQECFKSPQIWNYKKGVVL